MVMVWREATEQRRTSTPRAHSKMLWQFVSERFIFAAFLHILSITFDCLNIRKYDGNVKYAFQLHVQSRTPFAVAVALALISQGALCIAVFYLLSAAIYFS